MLKVMFVDDDPNLLSGIRRQLRKEFNVVCAASGDEGLAKLANDSDISVVVSDMRMPGMDGVEFLGAVAERHPNSTRVMLTGNNDQQTAIDAVNKGHVFSFLNKPCEKEELITVVEAAGEHHRLRRLEQDLLENTLAGSIKVLLDVLTVVNPEAFGRVSRMKSVAEEVAKLLGVTQLWEVRIAVLTSSIGMVSIPDGIMAKIRAGLDLEVQESELVQKHAQVAHDLLTSVPRLQNTARVLLFQDKNFDGSGYPEKALAGTEIPVTSRILKVLNAITDWGENTAPDLDKCAALPLENGMYDPDVVAAVQQVLAAQQGKQKTGNQIRLVETDSAGLLPGDILDQDILDSTGSLLLSAGNELTPLQISRMLNHPKFEHKKDKYLVKRRFH